MKDAAVAAGGRATRDRRCRALCNSSRSLPMPSIDLRLGLLSFAMAIRQRE